MNWLETGDERMQGSEVLVMAYDDGFHNRNAQFPPGFFLQNAERFLRRDYSQNGTSTPFSILFPIDLFFLHVCD